jgi:hypothetical protein
MKGLTKKEKNNAKFCKIKNLQNKCIMLIKNAYTSKPISSNGITVMGDGVKDFMMTKIYNIIIVKIAMFGCRKLTFFT